MPKKIIKINFVFAGFFLVLALALIILEPQKSGAANYKTLSGFAWNENFGYIKFSGDVVSTPNKYGISLDTETGYLSGYAWSENVGWISFNAADVANCPTKTTEICAPRFVRTAEDAPSDFNFQKGSKAMAGWAKILADASWIRFSGTAQSGTTYGPRLHSDGTVSGYAWSDKWGWTSFEGANYQVKVDGISNRTTLTVTGAGFKQGATVKLINQTGGLHTIDCGAFDLIPNSDGKQLTGSCPLSDAFVGDWDVAVSNPPVNQLPQVAKLSDSKSADKFFKIIAPTASDFSITPTSFNNTSSGILTLTKITSSNSLFGARMQLIQGNDWIDCIGNLGTPSIKNYDITRGWVPDINESMTCNLTGKTGAWDVVVYRSSWSEKSATPLTLSCTDSQWNPDPSTFCPGASFEQTSNCGTKRIVTNGTKSCGTNETCSVNQCLTSCIPESNAAFCQRLGKNCGTVTAKDNCNNSRTVSCGTCFSPTTCGGGGTANVCGCTDTTWTPTNISDKCLVTQTSNCGNKRTISGGITCSSNQTCLVTTGQCVCGDISWTQNGSNVCQEISSPCGNIRNVKEGQYCGCTSSGGQSCPPSKKEYCKSGICSL